MQFEEKSTGPLSYGVAPCVNGSCQNEFLDAPFSSPHSLSNLHYSNLSKYDESSEKMDKQENEALMHRLNETEGRLTRLKKQHEELAIRCDEAENSKIRLKQQAELSKAEATALRKQISASVNGETEYSTDMQGWIRRALKAEQELIDTRREKNRLSRNNIEFKAQVAGLQATLSKKQEHIQMILDDRTALNKQANTFENEARTLREKLIQDELRMNQLDQELAIVRERCEKSQAAVKEIESLRDAADWRMNEVIQEHQDAADRYSADIQRLTSLLTEERNRVDELLVKLDQRGIQLQNYTSQMDELRQQLESALSAKIQQSELVRKANELTEEQGIKIMQLKAKVSTLEIELKKAESSSSDSETQQINLHQTLANLRKAISTKEQDLTAINFQCNVISDQLKRLENEKYRLTVKHRAEKERMQSKHARVVNLIRAQARQTAESISQEKNELQGRLNQSKRREQLLTRLFDERTDQLNKMSGILWETGWQYAIMQSHLAEANAAKQDDIAHRSVPLSSNIPTQSAVPQTDAMGTDCKQCGLADQMGVHSILSWASADLDALISFIEASLPARLKGKQGYHCTFNRITSEGSMASDLSAWLLQFKSKITWITRQYKLLRRLCRKLSSASHNRISAAEASKSCEMENLAAARTFGLKDRLDRMETEAAVELIASGRDVAQVATERLKSTYSKLSNDLETIRRELRILQPASR
ncbi:unnamed protein product [Calicophoron daubneyi]|uniref:Uncharacterized protein n=1 Tax=Calicophoron daubneyi TaxID=300641 RepID=A0AAV2TRY6_CALDB